MEGRGEAEWLGEASRELGVPLAAWQIERLLVFADRLLEATRRVNLTGIREREGVLVKHLLDSLTAAALVGPLEEGRAVDVGSGAGLPGIPLAVARPHLLVFLVEAVRKKAAFLQQAAAELELANVQVVVERAEELGHRPGWRETADWAFARAVGSLAVSVELCAPLVRVGGRVVVMKGPGVEQEWEVGLQHARRGGLELAERRALSLPGGIGRVLVVLEKKVPCPERWPRRPGRVGRP